MAGRDPIGVAAFEPAFRTDAAEPDWLRAFRAAGAERFSAAGLPTNRDEAWKYTSLRPLARAKFQPLPANDVSDVQAPAPVVEHAAQAVFLNGRYRADLSDLAGVDAAVQQWNDDAGWLADAVGAPDDSANVLYALNAAAFEDGLTVKVAAGETLARPLEIVFLARPGDAPAMWHPRVAIDIGDGASATVLERHLSAGEGAYLANHAGDIRLGAEARLSHAKLQAEAADGRHMAMTRVDIGQAALYDNFVLTTGTSLSRSEIAARLLGEDSEVRLNGAYAIDGRRHADHSSRIEHRAENTRSRQVFAGAIDENARGVFQGHIVVDRIAQRTDGHQLNRALLLSDEAEIDSKPVLEIYADDVKCSHGATAGDIDADQLFYLRARGVPAEQARRLVVRGFLADAAEGLGDDALRAAVLAAIDDALDLETGS